MPGFHTIVNGMTGTGDPIVPQGAQSKDQPLNTGNLTGGTFTGMHVSETVKGQIEQGSAADFFYFTESTQGGYDMHARLPEYGCEGQGKPVFKLRENNNRLMKGISRKFIRPDGTMDYDRGLEFLRQMEQRLGLRIPPVAQNPDKPLQTDGVLNEEDGLEWLATELEIPAAERHDFKNFCRASLDLPSGYMLTGQKKALGMDNFIEIWRGFANNCRVVEEFIRDPQIPAGDANEAHTDNLFQKNVDLFQAMKQELLDYANIDPATELRIIVPTECSGSTRSNNYFCHLANQANIALGKGSKEIGLGRPNLNENVLAINIRNELTRHNEFETDEHGKKKELKWDFHYAPVVGSFIDEEGHKRYLTIEAFAPEIDTLTEHPGVTGKVAIGVYNDNQDFIDYYYKDNPYVEQGQDYEAYITKRQQINTTLEDTARQEQEARHQQPDPAEEYGAYYQDAREALEAAGPDEFVQSVRKETSALLREAIALSSGVPGQHRMAYERLTTALSGLAERYATAHENTNIHLKIYEQLNRNIEALGLLPNRTEDLENLRRKAELAMQQIEQSGRAELIAGQQIRFINRILGAMLHKQPFALDADLDETEQRVMRDFLQEKGFSKEDLQALITGVSAGLGLPTEGVLEIRADQPALAEAIKNKSLDWTTEELAFAGEHFDALTTAIFSPEQRAAMETQGHAVFDHLYLDGVNASDFMRNMLVPGPNGPQPLSEEQQKAFVISQLLNGAQLDAARRRDDNTVEILPVRASSGIPSIQAVLSRKQYTPRTDHSTAILQDAAQRQQGRQQAPEPRIQMDPLGPAPARDASNYAEFLQARREMLCRLIAAPEADQGFFGRRGGPVLDDYIKDRPLDPDGMVARANELLLRFQRERAGGNTGLPTDEDVIEAAGNVFIRALWSHPASENDTNRRRLTDTAESLLGRFPEGSAARTSLEKAWRTYQDGVRTRDRIRNYMAGLISNSTDVANAGQEVLNAYMDFVHAIGHLSARTDELYRMDADGNAPALTRETRQELSQIYRAVISGAERFRQVSGRHPALAGAREIAENVMNLAGGDLAAVISERQISGGAPTLPALIENARIRTVDITGRSVSRAGAGTSARFRMTIPGPDGQPVEGFFTQKKTLRHPGEDIGRFRQELTRRNPQAGEVLTGLLKHSTKFQNLINRNVSILLSMGRNIRTRYLSAQLYAHAWDEYLLDAGYSRKQIDRLVSPSLSDALCEYIDQVAVARNAALVSKNIGIRQGDNIDRRNAAMTTAAELLGIGSLLAPSAALSVKQADRVVEGTFMAFGKGSDVLNPQLNGPDDPMQEFRTDTPLSNQAIRQLLSLQTLDFICGNADRHAANMMYQFSRDEQGNLILDGVQGIDNDMSFYGKDEMPDPENLDPDADLDDCAQGVNKFELDPLKVIPQSMATRILEMDPAVLRTSLRQYGLSELQLDKAVHRLQVVQERITRDLEYFRDKPLSAIEEKRIHVIPDERLHELSGPALDEVEIIRRARSAPNIRDAEMEKRQRLERAASIRSGEETLTALQVKVQDAEKHVWGGSDEYTEMKNALERVITDRARLTRPGHIEAQLKKNNTYVTAYGLVRHKEQIDAAITRARIYIDKKNGEGPLDTKAQRRVDAARSVVETLTREKDQLSRLEAQVRAVSNKTLQDRLDTMTGFMARNPGSEDFVHIAQAATQRIMEQLGSARVLNPEENTQFTKDLAGLMLYQKIFQGGNTSDVAPYIADPGKFNRDVDSILRCGILKQYLGDSIPEGADRLFQSESLGMRNLADRCATAVREYEARQQLPGQQRENRAAGRRL